MESVLSDRQFRWLQSFLAGWVGLDVDDGQRDAVSQAVVGVSRDLGLGGVAGLLGRLPDVSGTRERAALVDAVTAEETCFFRAAPQVDALRRVVLPRLLRRAEAQGRPLTVWSAGCATGEEAYTLAMLLLDLLSSTVAAVPVRVLGTDVSALAISAACRARYGARTVATAAPADRERWLRAEGSAGWSVAPQVRDVTAFAVHNLATSEPPVPPESLDLVVCRDVTTSFDRTTTAAVLRRFHGALTPGGYLLLGLEEPLRQLTDAFELLPVGDAFVYRRFEPASTRAAVTVAGRREARWGARVPEQPRVEREGTPSSAGSRPVPLPDDARPQHARSLLAAARRAQLLGRCAEAAVLAERATVLDPVLAEAYVVAGLALVTLRRDPEALAPLRTAVYLAPGAGDAHFLLAGVQERLGWRAAAAREYRLAATTLSQVAAPALDVILEGRRVEDVLAYCLQHSQSCGRTER